MHFRFPTILFASYIYFQQINILLGQRTNSSFKLSIMALKQTGSPGKELRCPSVFRSRSLAPSQVLQWSAWPPSTARSALPVARCLPSQTAGPLALMREVVQPPWGQPERLSRSWTLLLVLALQPSGWCRSSLRHQVRPCE